MKFHELSREQQNHYAGALTRRLEYVNEMQSSYGLTAIRSLLLLNGGSAVAIISFKGVYLNLYKDLTWANSPLYWFILGIALTMGLVAFEYFRFLIENAVSHKRAIDFFENKLDHERINAHLQRPHWEIVFPILLALAATACFIVGVVGAWGLLPSGGTPSAG